MQWKWKWKLKQMGNEKAKSNTIWMIGKYDRYIPIIYFWPLSSKTCMEKKNGPGTYCLCAMSFYLFHTKAHGCTTAITIIIQDSFCVICHIHTVYAMCIYDIHATLLMTTQKNTYISANLSPGIQEASTVDPASSVGACNCTLSQLTHTPNCFAHRFYKGVI